MNLTLDSIVAMLGILGIGSILGGWLGVYWERRKAANIQQQDFKFIRYKCIVMLMYHLLHFDRDRDKLREFGRNFGSKAELLDELDAEWHNMIIFSSNDAILALREFLQNPSDRNYLDVAIAFRKDLWPSRSALAISEPLVH